MTRMKPVAALRHCSAAGVMWDALMLWCPGCDDVNMLPVTGERAWGWNGDLVNVTLDPSVLTMRGPAEVGGSDRRCHSFLRDGIWDFLDDCTHGMAGQKVPMVPLPDWVVREAK